MVALGQDIAGMFGNDDKLLKTFTKISLETGDKVWQLPLEKGYKDLIKSHIADVKNIGTGKYAGAITAALFLEEFINKTSWAHLDIAGPSMLNESNNYSKKFMTGFGVRLLFEFVQNSNKKK